MPKVAAKRATRSKTKTIPYDVAAQLRTPEEIAAYLDAWLDEFPDDAAGIARALGDIARAKGMTQVARDAGVILFLSTTSIMMGLAARSLGDITTICNLALPMSTSYR